MLAHLSLTVSQRMMSLPMGLLQLRPPPCAQQQQQQQQGDAGGRPGGQPGQQGHGGEQGQAARVHHMAASEGLLLFAERSWPPERRAQKLSYALAAILLDVSSTSAAPPLGTSACAWVRACSAGGGAQVVPSRSLALGTPPGGVCVRVPVVLLEWSLLFITARACPPHHNPPSCSGALGPGSACTALHPHRPKLRGCAQRERARASSPTHSCAALCLQPADAAGRQELLRAPSTASRLACSLRRLTCLRQDAAARAAAVAVLRGVEAKARGGM